MTKDETAVFIVGVIFLALLMVVYGWQQYADAIRARGNT